MSKIGNLKITVAVQLGGWTPQVTGKKPNLGKCYLRKNTTCKNVIFHINKFNELEYQELTNLIRCINPSRERYNCTY